MKLTTLAVLAGIFASSAALAQNAPVQNSAPANGTTTLAQQSQGSQWADGQASAGKSHAEVYQSLVHAEQDGHRAYLNRTLYAHH
jgi:hypothetical protein